MSHQMPEDLIETQLRLESEMTQAGYDRYIKEVTEARVGLQEDTLAPAKTLMKHHNERLALAIQDWTTAMSSGQAGRRGVAWKYLEGKDPSVLAFLTQKRLLSGVSRPQVVQRVARELGQAVEDEQHLAKVREDERKTFNSILRGAKKRVSGHYKRVYAMRRAADSVVFDTWGEIDQFHVGMKLIDIAVETLGWFTLETSNVGSVKNPKTQNLLVASPELLAQIEEHHGIASMMRPRYEPMVVIPRDWSSPTNGGYLSSDIRPIRLVKTTSRGYFAELEHTEMPVVYAAVNALQRTAWGINTEVLSVLTALWNVGNPVAGLPAKHGQEIPPKPFDIADNEESRKDWRGKAFQVHQTNSTERSRRRSVESAIDVATRYSEYPSGIHMPYQLDFRGRIYAVPSFNPQGPDEMKSLLRFAVGKPLGEHGASWLAMHGANVAGNDKITLEKRVQWVLDNELEICRIAEDPYANGGWHKGMGGLSKIDKPWQFLAFCFEWAGYVEFGEEFVSRLPVALDGSCSGLQHFSAMLLDEIGGATVNLTPTETPSDVYGMVAEKVNIALKAQVASGPVPNEEGPHKWAAQWLTFGVNRGTCKRPVMTLAYGSRQFGFRKAILKETLDPARISCLDADGVADPSVFPFTGDAGPAAGYMAKLIWEAVTVTLVKAVEAMTWLQHAASLVSSEGLPVRWTSPVGFPVMQDYRDMSSRRVETALHGKMLRVTMQETTEGMDHRSMSNGIAPNFVHGCDAAHMMLTTVRSEQEGIGSFAMIHDSFGTLAADTEGLFRIVRESFVELYTGVEVLVQFKEEIARQLSDGNLMKLDGLPSAGSLDLQGVLESKFCFA